MAYSSFTELRADAHHAGSLSGAAVALAAAQMALAGACFPIPLDEVIDAQSLVGSSIPPSLRETAQRGLAVTKTGLELAEKVQEAVGR